jgi:hypothetical protein
VYCSVFLLFSRCIDHFICYSHIVYIGDSLGHMICLNLFPVGSHNLGHMICLLIYFLLAAMLLNILKCISMFILLPLTFPSGAYKLIKYQIKEKYTSIYIVFSNTEKKNIGFQINFLLVWSLSGAVYFILLLVNRYIL